MEKEKHTCEELEEIVRTLRGENGCPWDRVQTFQSLRSCLIEEAYEYVAAVRIFEETGSAENLQEELGDLLFQVVTNSRIAEEQGLFTLSDVVKCISEKMIRRHPHIFAGKSGAHEDGSQKSWDEIKKQEKEGKDWIASPLREIPAEHPALIRAPKVIKKVDKLYEPYANEAATLLSLSENVAKLQELIRQPEQVKSVAQMRGQEPEQQRTEIMGELLMNVCNLGRIWGLPLEQILQDRIENLICKEEAVEKQ